MGEQDIASALRTQLSAPQPCRYPFPTSGLGKKWRLGLLTEFRSLFEIWKTAQVQRNAINVSTCRQGREATDATPPSLRLEQSRNEKEPEHRHATPEQPIGQCRILTAFSRSTRCHACLQEGLLH